MIVPKLNRNDVESYEHVQKMIQDKEISDYTTTSQTSECIFLWWHGWSRLNKKIFR
ncbi:hypothetical protein ABKV19_026698 [Rosa sericea]